MMVYGCFGYRPSLLPVGGGGIGSVKTHVEVEKQKGENMEFKAGLGGDAVMILIRGAIRQRLEADPITIFMRSPRNFMIV